MRKYNLRRVISFHGRVKAAREFSAEMPDVIAWMPARARPRRGAMERARFGCDVERTPRPAAASLSRSRAERARRCSATPAASARGWMCRASTVLRSSTRAVRPSTSCKPSAGRSASPPTRQLGTIVLPVFLSADEDPDRVLDESHFKYVWDVLKALRAHDEALGEELDELRRDLGRPSAPRSATGKDQARPSPRRVGADFIRAFNARLVERTTASWEYYFGLLERFVEREGHARVPQGHREDGDRLGLWVALQRQTYRERRLDPERRAQLEAMPGWTWDTRETAWEDGYARLREFVAREGHARVPQGHREDGNRLGRWVMKQRQAHRDGRLDPERRARLEALRGLDVGPARGRLGGGLRPPGAVRRARRPRARSWGAP